MTKAPSPSHVTVIRIGNVAVVITRDDGRPAIEARILPFPEMRSRT